MADQTNGNEKSRKQRPAFSKRYYPLELCVYEFRNGEDQRLNHSLKVSKSFRRTPESEWETSDFLAPEDALVAAQLLTEGFVWVQHRRNEDYHERRSQRDEVLEGATAGAEFPADIPF